MDLLRICLIEKQLVWPGVGNYNKTRHYFSRIVITQITSRFLISTSRFFGLSPLMSILPSLEAQQVVAGPHSGKSPQIDPAVDRYAGNSSPLNPNDFGPSATKQPFTAPPHPPDNLILLLSNSRPNLPDKDTMANQSSESGEEPSNNTLHGVRQDTIFHPSGFPTSGISAAMTNSRNMKDSWIPGSHIVGEHRYDDSGGWNNHVVLGVPRPPPPKPEARSERVASEGMGFTSRLHAFRNNGETHKRSFGRLLHSRRPTDHQPLLAPEIRHLRSSSEPLHTTVLEDNRADTFRQHSSHLDIDKELIKSELKLYYSVRNDLIEQLNSLQWRFDSETSRFHALKTELEQLERRKAELLDANKALREQNRQLDSKVTTKYGRPPVRPINDALVFYRSETDDASMSSQAHTTRSAPQKLGPGAPVFVPLSLGATLSVGLRDRSSLDSSAGDGRLKFWRRLRSSGNYTNTLIAQSLSRQRTTESDDYVPAKPPKVAPYPSKPAPSLRRQSMSPSTHMIWGPPDTGEHEEFDESDSLDTLDPLSSSYYTEPG